MNEYNPQCQSLPNLQSHLKSTYDPITQNQLHIRFEEKKIGTTFMKSQLRFFKKEHAFLVYVP